MPRIQIIWKGVASASINYESLERADKKFGELVNQLFNITDIPNPSSVLRPDTVHTSNSNLIFYKCVCGKQNYTFSEIDPAVATCIHCKSENFIKDFVPARYNCKCGFSAIFKVTKDVMQVKCKICKATIDIEKYK